MTRPSWHRIRRIYASHSPWVWLCWAVGALVLISTPLALTDPGMLMLIVDPEVVAMFVLGGIGVAMASPAVVTVRAAARTAITAAGRLLRMSGSEAARRDATEKRP